MIEKDWGQGGGVCEKDRSCISPCMSLKVTEMGFGPLSYGTVDLTVVSMVA